MNITKVGVIGAGVMGTGIAQIIAQSGLKVVVRSRRGRDGLRGLEANLSRALQKGSLTNDQVEAIMSNVSVTKDLCDATEDSEVIIEAVVEDLEVKKGIFRELDALSQEHTILATNTSSLSIEELAKVTNRPDKVIGMHFFNPPQIMKLVEAAATPLTSKVTIEIIEEFSRIIGKTTLFVKDCPGFIVNRILVSMINEAVFLFEDGVSTADNIDRAMRLGANHPMGPLALADLIGIDVCLNIMNEFHARFKQSKYKPCPLLKRMVDSGTLGRKTKKGFFTYE